SPRGEGVVPDLAGALPGVAADCDGGERECAVGDPRVEVHPAVVFVRDDVVPHVRRLRVAADDVVVEGGSRLKHGSQGAPLYEWGEESLADEPAGLVAALAERILLDERAEDVGDRLGERSALAL